LAECPFLHFDEPKRDLLANCHSFEVMTARSYEFVQLDVFTRTPLTGNPLAVFTDARGLSDKEIKALAREMNLSESWQRRCPIARAR